jgi:integrase
MKWPGCVNIPAVATMTPFLGVVTMSAVHRTRPPKPAKPSPDFPLFPHASGRWAKKIRGKLHYFGKWVDGPDAALEKYLTEKDDLHAGRTPRLTPDALTVSALCGKFLTLKEGRRDIGELSPRSFIDYTMTCRLLIKVFGKGRLVSDLHPDDFEKLRASTAKRWGPVRRGNEIVRCRSVFKFAFDQGLIDKPIRFGEGFKKPDKKTLRRHRASRGAKMFEAEELRRMLDAAGQPLKAMILLGVNCGFGNADCGLLPMIALDLDQGWVNFPRPKTGIERRCWLWPETVAAIREWLMVRPQPKDAGNAGLVFVTKAGGRWHKDIPDSPISKETRKLLDSLGINGHRSFYALRHVFETIGGDAKDQVAVDAIMGHAVDDMASKYRERISDGRLEAVAEHVRAWLFGEDVK